MNSIEKVFENIDEFNKELQSNKILKFDLEFSSSLEIIPSSIGQFFDLLSQNATFDILNLFDPTLNINNQEKIIRFNNHNIIKKEKYSPNELIKCLDNCLNSNQVTTTSISYIQDQILNSYINKSNIYLTFLNLYYQRKNDKMIYSSPLVFFKVRIEKELGTYKLSLDYNSPLFNTILFRIIKQEYSIDLSNEKFYFNIDDYISQITKKIEMLNFGLDKSLHLIQHDLIKDLEKVELVKYNDSNLIVTNNIFNTLTNSTYLKETNKFTTKNEQFKTIEESLNTLAEKSIVQLNFKTPLEKEFVKQAIEENILKKQNVLYLTSSTSKEKEVKKQFVADYFDPFLANKHPFYTNTNLYNLIKSVSIIPKNALDAEMVYKKQELIELNQDFCKVDSTIKNMSSTYNDDQILIFKKYFQLKEKSDKIFSFDLKQEYTYTQYLKDLELLNYIDNNQIFKEKTINQLKYHQISPLLNDYEFDMFISFLKQLKNTYYDVFKYIELSKIYESKFSPFSNLNDYYESIKLFKIYEEFPLFDSKYFKIEFTKEIKSSIESLIECYRLQASINLSINLACNPTIWLLNFDEVLESLNDRSKEKETEKKFKSIIKISPFKKTFKTLIVLLDKYQSNVQKLRAYQKDLVELFPEEINSIDSLLQLQKAYEYIDKYNNFINMHRYLNFENNFTNNIFTNKEYFDQFKINLPKLKASISQFEECLEKFEVIINLDKKQLINSSKDEVINLLDNLIDGTKEEFLLSLNLNKLIDKSSQFIKEGLAQSKDDLSNFKTNFTVSIYQYTLLFDFEKIGGTKTIENSYKLNQEYYFKSIKNLNKIDSDFYNTFVDYKTNLLNSPSYNQILRQYKREYQSGPFYDINRGLQIAGDLYYHLAPLEVLNIKQAIYLQNYKFDLAIIEYDNLINIEDLYYIFKLSNKVIIINNLEDKLPVIPFLTFNLNKDLDDNITYSNLDPFVKDKINLAFKRHNILLQENKIIDKEITLDCYFEIDNQKYFLNIEYTKQNLTHKQTQLITNFLYYNYNIKTVYLYLIPFLIYQDLCVSLIYTNVNILNNSEFINSQKNQNLTNQQKQKIDFYSTLDNIDKSFIQYSKDDENLEDKLRRSSLQERSIQEISFIELGNGIITYLEGFEYLPKDVLIKRLSNVVGTNNLDIDFILLFRKAVNYLKENNKVIEKDNHLYLVR